MHNKLSSKMLRCNKKRWRGTRRAAALAALAATGQFFT
jgi:hypothetical protein